MSPLLRKPGRDEVGHKMAAAGEDSRNVAEAFEDLSRVAPQNRDLYREIFIDSDSEDEFDGFIVNDSDSDSENASELTEDFTDRFRWSDGDPTLRPPPFTGLKKVNANIPDNDTFLDYFSLFLTDDVVDLLVLETNRYAADFLLKNPDLKEHSRFKNWVVTSNAEMKTFIGCVIAMGLLDQIDLQDYWSKDEVLSTPFFASVISRN